MVKHHTNIKENTVYVFKIRHHLFLTYCFLCILKSFVLDRGHSSLYIGEAD